MDTHRPRPLEPQRLPAICTTSVAQVSTVYAQEGARQFAAAIRPAATALVVCLQGQCNLPGHVYLPATLPLTLLAEFLEAAATYVTQAPFPRLWMQGSASEPASPVQIPVPVEHAAFFDASTSSATSTSSQSSCQQVVGWKYDGPPTAGSCLSSRVANR